jgi:hypothetical protein
MLVLFAHDVTAGTYSIADDAGNTYREDFAADFAANVGIHIWSAIANATGFLVTTVTHPSMTPRAGIVLCITGPSQTLTGTATSATGSTDTPSSPSLTPGVNGALVVGFVGREGPGTVDETFTHDAEFTLGAVSGTGTSGGGAASNISCGAALLEQATAAGIAYDSTLSSARDWLDAILAYAPAADARVPYNSPYRQLLAQ